MQFVRGSKAALLILPGIGYGPSGMRAMKRIARKNPQLDIFIPDYVSRKGLSASVRNVEQYMKEWNLQSYPSMYVMCFIAGGYAFQDLLTRRTIKNLKGLILDRSPYQERAPSIVARNIPWIARALLGSFVFDLAERRYPDFSESLKQYGFMPSLIIEMKRTLIVRLFAKSCRNMGIIRWEPEALQSAPLDYCYVPYNHDSIYSNFDKLWPLVQSMIDEGSFGNHALRQPPIES